MSEPFEHHTGWTAYFYLALVLFEVFGVDREYALRRLSCLVNILAQKFIPVLDKPHMRINLKLEGFSLVHGLHLIPRVKHVLGFFEGDFFEFYQVRVLLLQIVHEATFAVFLTRGLDEHTDA